MNLVLGILLDLILLGILLLCIKGGTKNGFAKTVVGFLGIFLSLVIAASLAKPLANLVYEKTIEKPVQTAVSGIISDELDQVADAVPDKDKILSTIQQKIDVLPSFVKKAINIDGDSEEFNNILSVEDIDAEQISKNICDTYVRPAANSVLTAVIFVVLFIILAIVFKVISKALKLVNKIPLLGGLNSLLGGIAGFLKGAIIVLIINWAIILIVGDSSSLFKIITPEVINSSLITKKLGAINPLNALLDSIVHSN